MQFRSSYKLVMVLVMISSAGRAGAVPTVGVYDENTTQANAVDFEATGSNISLSQFTTEIADAFANDQGGVNDGWVSPSLPLQFGADRSEVQQKRR